MTTVLDKATLGYGQTLLGFEVESGSVKTIFRQLNDVLVCRHVSDCEDIMVTGRILWTQDREMMLWK